jgi:toxin ParE1/3/4
LGRSERANSRKKMSKSFVVKPSAELDLTEAYLWYEERLTNLGLDFIGEVEKVFVRIKANPESFEVKYKETRFAFTDRFPYAVHFIIEPKKIIVLAVLHTSRNPENWTNS